MVINHAVTAWAMSSVFVSPWCKDGKAGCEVGCEEGDAEEPLTFMPVTSAVGSDKAKAETTICGLADSAVLAVIDRVPFFSTNWSMGMRGDSRGSCGQR